MELFSSSYNNKIMKIGIIGVGMVGSASKKWFEKQDCELFLYDKYKKIGSIEEVNKADYIYVCVPTPYIKDLGCDTSIVEEVVGQIEEGKVVIIKSTIVPGTTEYIQSKFPNHKILFNPEFLTVETSDKDMESPDKQIIGYTAQSKKYAEEVLKQLPIAPTTKIIPSYVAEFIKYASNTYLALKVAKNNELYDIFKEYGGTDKEFKDITDSLVADPRIGDSHFGIWHDGWRGYGGICFPKDTKAFIDFAKELKVDTPITKAFDKYNDTLLRTQGRNPLNGSRNEH